MYHVIHNYYNDFVKATRYSSKLTVLKFNVEAPDTKNIKMEMLLKGVMIRALPTLVLFHSGVPLATHSGAITEEELNAWLDENLFSRIDTLPGDILGEMDSVVANTQIDETNNMKSKKESESKSRRGFVSMTYEADDYMLSNDK